MLDESLASLPHEGGGVRDYAIDSAALMSLTQGAAMEEEIKPLRAGIGARVLGLLTGFEQLVSRTTQGLHCAIDPVHEEEDRILPREIDSVSWVAQRICVLIQRCCLPDRIRFQVSTSDRVIGSEPVVE
jgi:hypothetical protein